MALLWEAGRKLLIGVVLIVLLYILARQQMWEIGWEAKFFFICGYGFIGGFLYGAAKDMWKYAHTLFSK